MSTRYKKNLDNDEKWHLLIKLVPKIATALNSFYNRYQYWRTFWNCKAVCWDRNNGREDKLKRRC